MTVKLRILRRAQSNSSLHWHHLFLFLKRRHRSSPWSFHLSTASSSSSSVSPSRSSCSWGWNSWLLRRRRCFFPLRSFSFLGFSASLKKIMNKKKADVVKFLIPNCSFQPISNADFIVPVEIDGTVHQVRKILPPSFPNLELPVSFCCCFVSINCIKEDVFSCWKQK